MFHATESLKFASEFWFLNTILFKSILRTQNNVTRVLFSSSHNLVCHLCVAQRRLSDPSANFNTFLNSGWRTRGGGVAGQEGGRSRSENEGLDSFADGLYEIESGDVRDGELR